MPSQEKPAVLSKKDAALAAKILCKQYKNANYYLNFKTPLDLLVAAIISAQTRDEIVNKITPALFSRYKRASDYAAADKEELSDMIKSVSFASKKASNIIEACKTIESKFNGEVPCDLNALLLLSGVGRKTANTIMINAFNRVEGIPVDTWVIKLAYRIGLSSNKKPDDIEKDLINNIPKEYWGIIAYVLKAHGKALCSKVPFCSKCQIEAICLKNGVNRRL